MGHLSLFMFKYFVIGHIARYKYDQFSWTAKSSELIEKKQLKWGSLMFHLGVIPVFFGHVVGLLIPANWLESIGVNDHIYHIEQYILVVFLV